MSVDTKPAVAQELITATIDGTEIQVPKGTLIIRAAEQIGIEIPRFCDHPLLDPAGCCRVCLVDIPDAGNGRPMKPSPACAQVVMPGMKVETAESSETVHKHQSGMLEFLLVNHPLDCPICDKGGECPLQNQAHSHSDRIESRFDGVKRTYPKPINLSAQILLDRERCVLCQRCTRFSEQISGDAYIHLLERGARSQIGIYDTQPYDSYFSGNVVQICPVGALTSADYRFQARPFDLVSTTVTCENCAAGCELRVDHRHGSVRRRLAGNCPEVNEEWNCDRGRFGFRYQEASDRLTYPLIRQDGVLRAASWSEAIDYATAGLAKAGSSVGVLTGGRLTVEACMAYSKFARAVLGTNNIDFRSRPISAEEESFLAERVAGKNLDESVTYAQIESAKKVLIVSLDVEDECPMVFLRLRKAWRKRGLKVGLVGARLSEGSRKMNATLIGAVPGREAETLRNLPAEWAPDADTVILVGERAAYSAGTLATVAALADQTGAGLAWIPRRSGEIGAIEAGCLPTLLPGGRQVGDAVARVDLQAAWAIDHLPTEAGLDVNAQIEAACRGDLAAMVIAGVDLPDLDRPDAAQALRNTFVVSIEQRASAVTELADVVFPVAMLTEQAGTFYNWEHRPREVNLINREVSTAMNDVRVLAALSDALGSDLGMRSIAQSRAAFAEIAGWSGERRALEAPASMDAGANHTPLAGDLSGLVLSTWRTLLGDSRCNDGASSMKATARPRVAAVNPETAEKLGVTDHEPVRVSDGTYQATLPIRVEPDLIDGVVWIPDWEGGVQPRMVTLSTESDSDGGAA